VIINFLIPKKTSDNQPDFRDYSRWQSLLFGPQSTSYSAFTYFIDSGQVGRQVPRPLLLHACESGLLVVAIIKVCQVGHLFTVINGKRKVSLTF